MANFTPGCSKTTGAVTCLRPAWDQLPVTCARRGISYPDRGLRL
ncbi:hypothetical protein LTSEMON_2436 [Salmonella enterica subsp. enterica serovar Montevideo str. S5-403]|uniref:Uncharacterized protein n=1 Tax=Salmonella enterica subsp. enterica serovar Montevideo str. S5-403 TaxID=913242 RepID=G5Q384_SALMO|nr:hypothetical protein LTSEMON_2436 [Salmonella enterica subsp. enterica serovar Montevideo str. S5-403]